ncbi:MAG: secretion system protein [Firmicutes bacterium]|nr:secretion system protein [Bacillota bacterium]
MDLIFGTLLALTVALALYVLLTFPRSSYAHMLRSLSTKTAAAVGAPTEEPSPLAQQLRLIPVTRRLTPEQFLVLQTVPAAGLFVAILTEALIGKHMPNLKVLLIAPPVIWLLPRGWLNAVVWQRQQAITRAYGDLVSHLVLMLDAGASTQKAFSTSVPVVREPLRTELVQLVADLKLSPLPSALQRFAERAGHKEIKNFTDNLVLQQKVGISLADALRDEERHSRVLQQEAARQRIRAGAVTMAAVTAVLLANGLILLALPVVGQWVSLMGGQVVP